jgi:3-oxoacyl-[acyl-carrier protein] reductase
VGRLEGVVAVITGAGSGIGRASALEFAREGARVVVADVRAQAARESMDLLRAEGAEAECVVTDVTRREQCEAMVQAAVDRFGRIDVLFNNAGLPMAFTPFEETSDDLWDRIYAVNVKGVFYGCRAAVPHMKRQGGGVILNTASTAGIRPRPGLAAYNSSKGAVITLTKSLAIELAPHRIRAVAICPVATETPMLAQFIGAADQEEGREQFIATVPWGRLNKPEDIARAAVFLASTDAEMVNGTAFEIDGARDI